MLRNSDRMWNGAVQILLSSDGHEAKSSGLLCVWLPSRLSALQTLRRSLHVTVHKCRVHWGLAGTLADALAHDAQVVINSSTNLLIVGLSFYNFNISVRLLQNLLTQTLKCAKTNIIRDWIGWNYQIVPSTCTHFSTNDDCYVRSNHSTSIIYINL